MPRGALCSPILILLAACGGGGGGPIAPVGAPARLSAADLDLPAGTSTVDLTVALAEVPQPAPGLLQVAIGLPAALAVATNDRLFQVQPVAYLDGDTVKDAFVVVCGDAHNTTAAPLQAGPLFRLRLVTTTPRQPGSYTITLRDLRAASSAGDELAVDGAVTNVSVTVH